MSGLGSTFTHATVWQLGKLFAIVLAMWALRKMRLGSLFVRWFRR